MGRHGPVAAARRDRGRTTDSYEGFLADPAVAAARSPAARPPLPGPSRSSSSTPGPSAGPPTAPSSPIGRSWPRRRRWPWCSGSPARPSYLNSGPMFHMATLMTTFATFADGWHQRAHPSGRRRGAVPGHRGRALQLRLRHGPDGHEIMEVNAGGRYDLSSLRTFGGSPAWNAMVEVDDSPVGAAPGRLRPDRGDRHAHLQRPGHRHRGHQWPALPVGPGPDRRSRTGPRYPAGETGEIVARGPIVTNGYHDRPQLNAERFRGGLVAHRRPRAAPRRRLDHLRRPADPHRQVGRREHLPRRGGGMPGPAPGGTRGGHHRRPRQALDPAGAGRGGPEPGTTSPPAS